MKLAIRVLAVITLTTSSALFCPTHKNKSVVYNIDKQKTYSRKNPVTGTPSTDPATWFFTWKKYGEIYQWDNLPEAIKKLFPRQQANLMEICDSEENNNFESDYSECTTPQPQALLPTLIHINNEMSEYKKLEIQQQIQQRLPLPSISSILENN